MSWLPEVTPLTTQGFEEVRPVPSYRRPVASVTTSWERPPNSHHQPSLSITTTGAKGRREQRRDSVQNFRNACLGFHRAAPQQGTGPAEVLWRSLLQTLAREHPPQLGLHLNRDPLRQCLHPIANPAYFISLVFGSLCLRSGQSSPLHSHTLPTAQSPA